MNGLTCIVLPTLLLSCASSPRLKEGTWSGSLAPMNHPEMTIPLTYEVSYSDDLLSLTLIGPDSAIMLARQTSLRADTVFFIFDEPEEGVPLHCALGKNAEGDFDGRCTDAGGKWARFTMTPPPGR